MALRFEMRPQDGGTLLIQRFEPLAGLVLSPVNRLAAPATRGAIPEGAARIKEKLEAGWRNSSPEHPLGEAR